MCIMTPRVVFMGSPEFAVPTLQRLADLYPVVGVVTQPDRPSGRGQTLTPPPVKILANQLGIPVMQPERLRRPEAFAELEAWSPDLIVVAAFGQILRQNVLDMPKFGCINVHASLLPRWRGAAPIQAAILAGDTVSGVTIMKMDAGIDTGAMLKQKTIPILPVDNAETLSAKLALSGADLLMEVLPAYLRGEIDLTVQDESQATYASMLKKEDGELDFTQPAEALARRVRALFPWPGTYTTWNGGIMKIIRAHAETSQSNLSPGQHGSVGRLPALAAVDGWLVLDEIQPAGKKAMPGEVFLRGARNWLES